MSAALTHSNKCLKLFGFHSERDTQDYIDRARPGKFASICLHPALYPK